MAILGLRYFWGVIIGLLTGCGAVVPPSLPPKSAEEARRHNFGSILGASGLTLQGKRVVHPSTQTTACVNKFLWQGALETLDFLPIQSASPQKGRLVTEWVSSASNVRLRVAVVIRGQKFRADAVTVFVERQKRTNAGVWKPYPFPKQGCTDLEVLIVERACQIRKEFLEKVKTSSKAASPESAKGQQK